MTDILKLKETDRSNMIMRNINSENSGKYSTTTNPVLSSVMQLKTTGQIYLMFICYEEAVLGHKSCGINYLGHVRSATQSLVFRLPLC